MFAKIKVKISCQEYTREYIQGLFDFIKKLIVLPATLKKN